MLDNRPVEIGQHQSGEADRLWTHALHEDNMFYQRGNLFLITESMMLVAYSVIVSGRPGAPVQARVIAGFGVLLTIAWAYVMKRHWIYLKFLVARATSRFPDYNEIVAARPKNRPPTTAVLVYAVPGAATIMWLLLLLLL
jgi:hypothetical protein